MMIRSRGFTLVEVMVALAIFTVVAVTLVKTATLSVRHAGLIEDRSTAWWLAENEITRLRLVERTDENFPRVGTDRTSVDLSSDSWELETRVESTENELVRRITVLAYKAGSDQPIVEVIAFIGRY